MVRENPTTSSTALTPWAERAAVACKLDGSVLGEPDGSVLGVDLGADTVDGCMAPRWLNPPVTLSFLAN